MITGESGTGKELVAQAIHNGGPRAGGHYVGINCAAIPRDLLESELFGYESGAFTGARRGVHPGKFEQADGGTLLLDEIGDMPLEMQAKLLRVLQERRVQRLGSTKEIPLNVRIIASTNRDIQEDIERGLFRQDLFFRLRVINIELPPLRERPEDIPVLLEHFLSLYSARMGKALRGATPRVLEAITAYHWPGNVREFEHCFEAEVNLASPNQELLTEVPDVLKPRARTGKLQVVKSPSPVDFESPIPPAASPGAASLKDNERELLLEALEANKGSVHQVALALGVSRGTVYNMMRRVGVEAEKFRRR